MYKDEIIREAFRITLIEIRKASGLSQMKLADESGLHRNFISLLETGQNIPSIITLYRLANALNISPSDFIKQINLKATKLSVNST